MSIRCNICLQDIDEKETESHVNTPQHIENKAKIAKRSEKGSDASVVKVWQSSFSNN
ncbi:MAG: hypothetical protein KGI27_11775 [Thaumarchaeota archaeon]|nr:hypothetical protein [Nitrososphaerota archaeon]